VIDTGRAASPIIGRLTENVYDSPSGRFLLIPQGSKLVGAYDSQISFGQDRVLLMWIRLIMLHQALGHRAPMAVWRSGIAARAVDMMDNARALPTCPQPQQQQQQTAFLAA
jgi:hypothetical protein